MASAPVKLKSQIIFSFDSLILLEEGDTGNLSLLSDMLYILRDRKISLKVLLHCASQSQD